MPRRFVWLQRSIRIPGPGATEWAPIMNGAYGYACGPLWIRPPCGCGDIRKSPGANVQPTICAPAMWRLRPPLSDLKVTYVLVRRSADSGRVFPNVREVPGSAR